MARPRIDRDRHRLERAAEHYLAACYRNRTAARASEFAMVLGVSHAYLTRTVRELGGGSVREFLRRRQLTHAAELLRATPLSAREIAFATAFGTESTFHRCFYDAFGMTPGEYRGVMSRPRRTTRFPRIARHPERRMPFLR